jgi:8-amino-7-oxononanoate synthase
VLGPQGRGLVCELGLEKDIAIRVHTFGKAVVAAGGTSYMMPYNSNLTGFEAVILGNTTIKTALINFARSVIYTTAPGFPMIACVRASYTLMSSGKMEQVKYAVLISLRF